MKKIISSLTLLMLICIGSISAANAQAVRCIAPGEFHNVSYDFGVNSSQSRTVLARAGADWGRNDTGAQYRCMGRCGANCYEAPFSSRMYTKDCLTHDACSYIENASGGSGDANCGDEFRDAIDDTALAIFNTCRYPRGDHRRAARGRFPQQPPQ